MSTAASKIPFLYRWQLGHIHSRIKFVQNSQYISIRRDIISALPSTATQRVPSFFEFVIYLDDSSPHWQKAARQVNPPHFSDFLIFSFYLEREFESDFYLVPCLRRSGAVPLFSLDVFISWTGITSLLPLPLPLPLLFHLSLYVRVRRWLCLWDFTATILYASSISAVFASDSRVNWTCSSFRTHSWTTSIAELWKANWGLQGVEDLYSGLVG